MSSAFAHTVVIVDSDDIVRRQVVPAVRRSLEDGAHVLMVVAEPTARVVRAELGGHDGLEWADRGAYHQRLGFAYESFRRYLAGRHAAGHRAHVVAEPDLIGDADTGGPADRAAAYLSYESVCNRTYAGYGSAVTCLWDARRYADHVVRDARSVHSHVLTEDGARPNPAYVEPETYLVGRHDVPMPPLPAVVDHDLTLTDGHGLRRLRTVLTDWTSDRSFAPAAAEDVLVAVSEVATNGLIHGAAPVRVRAWHRAGTLIVQADDAGGRPPAPTAGYAPPDPAGATPGGRGLWLARQLADTVLVEVRPGRTSVRLHFPHGLTHRGTAWAADRPGT